MSEQRDAASTLRRYSVDLRKSNARTLFTATPGPSRPYPSDRLPEAANELDDDRRKQVEIGCHCTV